MPQMSPLMWATLYSSFSILILFAVLKMYFNISSMKSESTGTEMTHNKIFIIKWMW